MVDRPATARPTQPKPDKRESARKRGYTWRWEKASRSFLQANPFCLYCTWVGRAVLATCTDHREPVTGPHDPRFWDPSNWAPCCHFHNSRKRDLPFNLWIELLKADNGGRLNADITSEFSS